MIVSQLLGLKSGGTCQTKIKLIKLMQLCLTSLQNKQLWDLDSWDLRLEMNLKLPQKTEDLDSTLNATQ